MSVSNEWLLLWECEIFFCWCANKEVEWEIYSVERLLVEEKDENKEEEREEEGVFLLVLLLFVSIVNGNVLLCVSVSGKEELFISFIGTSVGTKNSQ